MCIRDRGLHVFEDHFLPEIIDPATGEVLPPGETGELVFTSLTKEAFPVIRYRTRDITSLNFEPCICGRTHVRMNRVSGRSDDMLIIRGVNVYPSHIDEIISGFAEVGSEYQIILERGADGKDYMTLKVERERGLDPARDEEVAGRIAEEIKKRVLVSCQVQIVDYGSLPRTERKSKRVFDYRE